MSGRDIDLLAVMPEPYGGRGGIAQYGRDVIDAWTDSSRDVVNVTRRRPIDERTAPRRYRERSANGRAGFVATAFAQARRTPPRRMLCGHVHYLPLCIAAKRLTNAPLVLIAYGIDAFGPRFRGARAALREADLVIAISRYTRRRLIDWSDLPGHRVKVLPNAARLAPRSARAGEAERSRARATLELDDRTVILCLGRMDSRERYKGHDVLLDAMTSMEPTPRPPLLVLAGGGDDHDRLRRRAAALGLTESVRIERHVSDARRDALLLAADVFAMPSVREGFGFVYLEAMASGTPVVAGNRDGARDALRDGELGALVDPLDPSDVARGIGAALERPRGVPDGLHAFSYETFRRRLVALVDAAGSGRTTS